MSNRQRAQRYNGLETVTVRLMGRMGPISGNEKRAQKLLIDLGGSKQCVLLTPPHRHNDFTRGACLIDFGYPENGIAREVADGLLLPHHPGASMIMVTRDCQTVVFENRRTGAVVIVHAGREQVLDGEGRDGIILRALHLVAPDPADRRHVHVYITGGISAEHFTHNERPDLCRRYFRAFSNAVVNTTAGHTLDLERTTRLILKKERVPNHQVTSDGLCTFNTPWLGSKRAKKEESNWVVVIRKRPP